MSGKVLRQGTVNWTTIKLWKRNPYTSDRLPMGIFGYDCFVKVWTWFPPRPDHPGEWWQPSENAGASSGTNRTERLQKPYICWKGNTGSTSLFARQGLLMCPELGIWVWKHAIHTAKTMNILEAGFDRSIYDRFCNAIFSVQICMSVPENQ